MQTNRTSLGLMAIVGVFALLAISGCSKSTEELAPTTPKLDGSTAESSSVDFEGATSDSSPGGLTVVFTNNIDGEIEPCG